MVTNDGIQSLGKRLDELARVGPVDGRQQRFLVDVSQISVRNIVTQGVVEKRYLLRHQSDLLAQGLQEKAHPACLCLPPQSPRFARVSVARDPGLVARL